MDPHRFTRPISRRLLGKDILHKNKNFTALLIDVHVNELLTVEVPTNID
jgi:hypothetical protein